MCTPKRNLRRSARRASYIELRPEENQRAATRPAGGPREVAVETSALERGQRRQCLDQDFLRRVLCVLRVIKHADGDEAWWRTTNSSRAVPSPDFARRTSARL